MSACAIVAVRLVAAACLISGDSIGVGLANAMPECAVDARNCAAAIEIVSRVHAGYPVVIVSAGSNDAGNPRLIANLRAIRARTSGRVIWIRPFDGEAGSAVEIVASDHDDATVGFAPAGDRVHPRSAAALASDVRAMMKGK